MLVPKRRSIPWTPVSTATLAASRRHWMWVTTLALRPKEARTSASLRDWGEATGVVTSMYSMPNSSRALAISTLSWVEKFAFSNCSPSRKVESIIFHSRMHPSPKENRPEPGPGDKKPLEGYPTPRRPSFFARASILPVRVYETPRVVNAQTASRGPGSSSGRAGSQSCGTRARGRRRSRTRSRRTARGGSRKAGSPPRCG